MPNQESYGTFMPYAWEVIKKANLNEEERERLNLMIQSKTEAITYEEAKAMLYKVLHNIRD